MSHGQEQERAFDWDETIQNDRQEYVVAAPGDYDFEVVGFKRGRHTARQGGKLPDCNKAEMTIRIHTPEGQLVDINNALFLHSRCEGILCAFFRSIGHRKSGEPLRCDWPRTVGARGRCKVGIRKWKRDDGTDGEINEIKRYLDPPKNAPPPLPQQYQQQPQKPPVDSGDDIPF